MVKRTHYEVLGLANDASQEEVKRAYRRQAMARHPDRNPADPEAARKFRQAVQAYEVLGDERSRKAYDAELGVDRGWGRRLAGQAAWPAGPAARLEVRVNAAQAARGVRLSVDVLSGPACPECGGTGRTSRRVQGCGRCGGSGRITRRYGPVSEQAECPVCSFRRGRETRCWRCGGSGRQGGADSCILDIPPGAQDGDVLRLMGGAGVVEAVVRVV
ncbi:MAG: DnaJ domain-containing protein [Desulfovibrionaceae bacterium]